MRIGLSEWSHIRYDTFCLVLVPTFTWGIRNLLSDLGLIAKRGFRGSKVMLARSSISQSTLSESTALEVRD